MQASTTRVPACCFRDQWNVAYVKTMMKMYKTYVDYKILLKDIKENLDKDFPDGEDTILQRFMEK